MTPHLDVVHLVVRMSMGWGVSVALQQMARHWKELGHTTRIACVEYDHSMPELDIMTIEPTVEAVASYLYAVNADVVVAHTTPFFEIVPHLPTSFRRWAWEYGDPTPELFEDDVEIRQRIKSNKNINVYSNLDGVIAISKFIRHDINWPPAHVIPLGCDHITDQGCKQIGSFFLSPQRKLRIGTLMRMGVGEARYKGNALFAHLIDMTREHGLDVDFFAMGKGSDADAQELRSRGVKVYLNASDEERLGYLRDLDVFFSPSLWEGFNLPLVEAQAAGTLGVAFDTGAHPEVTPVLFSDMQELFTAIRGYLDDRHLLWSQSKLCYHFVRDRFSWRRASQQAAEFLSG